MRSSSLVLAPALVSALVSCGSPSSPATPATPVASIAAPDRSSAPLAPLPGPASAVEPVLPRNAALVASLDLATIEAELAASPAMLGEILEELTFLPRDRLAGGVRGLGLDPSRPVRLAIARPQDDELKAVASLPQQPKPQESSEVANPGALEALSRAVRSVAAPMVVRLILPVADADAFRKVVRSSLEQKGFTTRSEGVWGRDRQLVVLSGNDRSIALDLVSGEDVQAGLAALRADVAAGAAEVPAGEGQLVHLTYSPRALATHGILRGAILTVSAVQFASLEPAQAQRIASAGLWELLQWRTVTETSAGAYLDRVELSLTRRAGKLELVERLETGPGWSPVSDEVWKPSPSVKVEGTEAWFDASSAFLASVPLPGFDASSPRKPFEQFLSRVYQAGMASPVIHGHMLLAAARGVFEERGPELPFSTSGFERVGLFLKGPSAGSSRPGFFGVLPARTTRAAAECALAARSPCDARQRLKLGAIAPIGKAQGRLVQVGDRYVVLFGQTRELIQGEVTPTTSGAGATEFPARRLFGPVKPVGTLGALDRLSATVERDGKTIVLRVRSL